MADENTQKQENTENTAETVEVVADKPTKADFRVGDQVVVNYKITEGSKSRIQAFEGLVISKKGMGISKSFTVRRIGAGGVGVERIFPVQSPNIDSIKVKSRGKVRRAKLYYLRDRIGKSATRIA